MNLRQKSLAAAVSAAALGITLASCPAGGGTLRFIGVGAPDTDAERRKVIASPRATVDGQTVKIGFETILRSANGSFSDRVGHTFDRMPEVAVKNAIGDTTVTKHYAMGRTALALAYVMPDHKTAFLTDDGRFTGFFMFIADQSSDLSAGTLYAAKWVQTDGAGLGKANLIWINLGHATNGDVASSLTGAGRVTFAELFDATIPVANACPADYTLVVKGHEKTLGNTYAECLKLKPGMAKLASRLETRRYATLMGATTEPGEFVPKKMYGLIAGTSQANEGNGNTCVLGGIANPDNLTYLPGYDTLIIGEDTNSHQNDAVWSYDVQSNALTRIETTPYGSEATSVYWYPNIDGWGYLMSVIQHPYGESDRLSYLDTLDANDQGIPRDRGYSGYIGPFPALGRGGDR